MCRLGLGVGGEEEGVGGEGYGIEPPRARDLKIYVLLVTRASSSRPGQVAA